MIIISAMSENRVIGNGDGMPWSVPAEYQRYLDTDRGGAVIFGRKSYEIFGKDLQDATPVVVTSQGEMPGVRTAASLEEARAIADELPGETYVAGGASIYEQAIPHADVMLLSTIHGEFDGDTRFPEYDAGPWRLVRYEKNDGYDYREFRRHGDFGATQHRTLVSHPRT